jgi:hypothetical protein
LINGVTDQDRKPLLDGLPTLLFVDVGGTVSFCLDLLIIVYIMYTKHKHTGTKINEK